MNFIGIVKRLSSQYPKAKLSSIDLPERGQDISILRGYDQNQCDLGAVVREDRDGKYFVSTTSTTTEGQLL